MFKLIDRFFEVPRWCKRLITLSCDAVFITVALFGALYIRVAEESDKWISEPLFYVLAALIVLSIFTWVRLGLYRAVIRYMDIKVLANIFIGSLISFVLLFSLLYVFQVGLPRSVPFIYFTLIMTLIAGSRLFVRGLINTRNGKNRLPVAIYGAGAAGRQLCASLQQASEYRPVFFVDDDTSLHGTLVNDVRVYSPEFLPELVQKHRIEKVLFAIPSTSLRRQQEIFNKVQALKIEMLTIPGNADLISGKVSVSQLRHVDIQDLLGRETVEPDKKLLNKCIKNKHVLVTGAGGSIGSELARQIIDLKPESLVLLEQSEFNLYQIDNELRRIAPDVPVYPVLGSVLDKNLVQSLLAAYRIETIYHAAAYKHVPLVEYNVARGVANNVLGTFIVAEAALKQKVEHFVLISTDKAVRPTNVMGASKRVAELAVQGLAARKSDTSFSIVRFGNVLGSSGSVIPLFRKQIEQGGPVTVTHPEITRYFMTIPEAATLVIQAGAMNGSGDQKSKTTNGQVFVLDMGKPVKILDMATKMVHLTGLEVRDENNPEGDIEIKLTGLRPGEKLYEELLIGGDVSETDHPRIMRATEISMKATELKALLTNIRAGIDNHDVAALRELLIEAPTGFAPSSKLVDLLGTKVGNKSTGPEQ